MHPSLYKEKFDSKSLEALSEDNDLNLENNFKEFIRMPKDKQMENECWILQASF